MEFFDGPLPRPFSLSPLAMERRKEEGVRAMIPFFFRDFSSLGGAAERGRKEREGALDVASLCKRTFGSFSSGCGEGELVVRVGEGVNFFSFFFFPPAFFFFTVSHRSRRRRDWRQGCCNAWDTPFPFSLSPPIGCWKEKP